MKLVTYMCVHLVLLIFVQPAFSKGDVFPLVIRESGIRECSSGYLSGMTSASGWQEFRDKAQIRHGTTIEKRIKRNTANPHVFLIKSKAMDLDRVYLTRSATKYCSGLFAFFKFQRPAFSGSVEKDNYYDHLEEPIGGRPGSVLKSFNIRFRSKGACVNTRKFKEALSFNKEDMKLGLSNSKRTNSLIANERIRKFSQDYNHSILIPPAKEINDAGDLCAYVKISNETNETINFQLKFQELTK